MKKLHAGIVGCGGIANGKHLPALKAEAHRIDIIAFCDLIVDRAEKAKAEYGTPDAKIYTDYRELVQNPEIDIVYVLTPNVAHCPITCAAFECGKNVMCEKPMAASSADAEKMVAAWKKSGKQFTIGYQNRFRPEVMALKKACEKGELGDIYFAKAHAIRRRGVPTWGVFPNKALQGGGPLIDIGTHALDMTLWTMNNYKPYSVTGSVFYKMADAYEGNIFGPWDPATFETEDSAFGYIKMENGATIYLESSWALNILESREASVTLCGTQAGAEIHSGSSYPKNELIYNRVHNGLQTEEHLSAGGAVAFFEGSASAEPKDLECRQWLDAVEKGTSPLVLPEQALTVTRILEAIYRSHEQKKEIIF